MRTFQIFGQYRICIVYLKSRRKQLQHNQVIILMVKRVYLKIFNQRINVITVLKPHLSESIMTFWKLLTTTHLSFYYCLTYRLYLILSITRFWYQDWRIVSALRTLLNWFRSYLQLRKQFVFVNGIDSPQKDLQYGVPQENVLDPLLYSLYRSLLGDIARKHGIPFHLFEVDTPIYIYVSRLHLTALTIHPTRRRQLSCVLKILATGCCVINLSWIKRRRNF